MSVEDIQKKFEELLSKTINKEFPVSLGPINFKMTLIPHGAEQEAHLVAVKRKKDNYDDSITYFYALKEETLARAITYLEDFDVRTLGENRLEHVRNFLQTSIPTEGVNYLFAEWAKGRDKILNELGIAKEQTETEDTEDTDNETPNSFPEDEGDSPSDTNQNESPKDQAEKEQIREGMRDLHKKYDGKDVKPLPPGIYKEGQLAKE